MRKISLDNLPDLLTVREVAEILRYSTMTIKRFGNEGVLPFIRVSKRGDRRHTKEVVLKFLEDSKKGITSSVVHETTVISQE